ncbi:hypothetical protein [Pseudoxanthomonas kalamensis]|uniref:hypothetical protein n=1 Tax=Pseudoxanthomonas kalamensis TaxID=289483 RepID=UPI0013915557|nr:hypothetical protein [Pseudoxanthomonas kalamensis]
MPLKPASCRTPALLLSLLLPWAALAQAPTFALLVDPLDAALNCRADDALLPALVTELHRARPDDFTQVWRQYSDPAMDVYLLHTPVRAWGNESDAVAITGNRIMLAVRGDLDAVTARIDAFLQDSAETPMPALLDERHTLVAYATDLPGLQGNVLLGCEYRVEDVSLLDESAGTPLQTAPAAAVRTD